MRFWPHIIVGLILHQQIIWAQPVPPDQVPQLHEIDAKSDQNFDKGAFISKLNEKFSRYTSFQYSTQVGSPKDQSFATLAWKEAGNGYRYDFFTADTVKHTEIHKIIAFDGTETMQLREDNVIEIAKGSRPLRIPSGFPSPLDIYSFLDSDGKFMTLKDLASNSPIWSSILTRIVYAGTQKFMDQDCIVLRFLGSFNRHTKKKADYEVYFSTHDLRPLQWRAFDDQKSLIEQMEWLEPKPSEEHANAVSIFPTHCKATQYQWPGTITGPSGTIKYYKSIRDEYYKDVKTNELSAEDIQIDPSIAKEIIDVDTKKAIPIPK